MVKKNVSKKVTLKDIANIISKWAEYNNNVVVFHGAFIAFDKENNVKDDIMFAYGRKEVVKISIDGMLEEVDKDKNDFINW